MVSKSLNIYVPRKLAHINIRGYEKWEYKLMLKLQ